MFTLILSLLSSKKHAELSFECFLIPKSQLEQQTLGLSREQVRATSPQVGNAL